MTAAALLPHRRVVRSSGARLVGGVASGIAEHLGLSPFVVRLAFVALSIAGGVGVAMYAAFWLLLPQSANFTAARDDTNSDRVQLLALASGFHRGA